MDTPTPPTSGAAYLRWMLATAALLVAAVALFVVLVDPLGVFGSPRIAGLNAVKPHFEHDRELTHWMGAKRLCSKTAIFGNSRAEIGFNPMSDALLAHGLPAYDNAIPGTSADLSYRQLKWLAEAGCMPSTVFLGVDFFDFLGAQAAPAMSALDAAPAPRIDANFVAQNVLSLTGLQDSIETVAIQQARHPATLTDRGFDPLDNYVAEVERNGAYALFRQKAQDNIRTWRRLAPRIQPGPGVVCDTEQGIDAFVTRARAADAKVYLVIYPYHAETRLIVERLGLGALFAQWKKRIVDLAARHREPGQEIEVWDFSGLSPQTLEAIPAPEDRRTQLKWFWEAGHFKPALGDVALARMLGEPNGFGIRLAPANVDDWVARDRASVLAFMATPSPLLAELDSLLPPGAPRP